MCTVRTARRTFGCSAIRVRARTRGLDDTGREGAALEYDFDRIAPRCVSNGAIERAAPRVAHRARAAAHAQRMEIILAHDRIFAVADRAMKQRSERAGRHVRNVVGVVQHLHDRADGVRNGDVGARTFLRVGETYLDGVAVEARDGAARVEPLVPEHAARVERRDRVVHRGEDVALVARTRRRRLRHDGAQHLGNARGVRRVDR